MSLTDKLQSLPLDLDGPTVTSYLVQHPTLSPHRAAAQLFPKPFLLKRIWLRFSIKDNLYHRTEPDSEQIQRALKSGRWSSDPNKNARPGELFLKIFADVLLCLDRNRLSGLVSPPLIASCGVIPLTILSVIPHILQHYYDCIVLAQHEVLLATNYLQKSDSQRKICEALIELSKRVGLRGQKQKVVVKLIYDRGNWKQVFKNHQPVKPQSAPWKDVGLPSDEDIPNLELQVINFHRVLLGTFHSKFMVVDRKVALINSNNIQDRPNIEMMVHLEGPIVNSFYDMFLISWSNKLAPPLPLLAGAPDSDESIQSETSRLGLYHFASDNPFLRNIDVVKSAQDALATLNREAETDRIASANQQPDGIMNSTFATAVRDLMEERRRPRPLAEGSSSEVDDPPRSSPSTRFSTAVQNLIDERRKSKLPSHNIPQTPLSRPSSLEPRQLMPPAPNILGGKDAHTITTSTTSRLSAESPTTTTIGSSLERSESKLPPLKVSIKTDSDNLRQLVQHHERRDSTDNTIFHTRNESSHRRKPSTSNKHVRTRMRALSDALNAGTLRQADANVSADHPIGDFQPHIIHPEHEEFPIVMVNRPPHGLPGHNDIRVPQNAAWMAAFKYAKKKVFIQTPTLNSAPVVRMCIDTAKRGVKVILYLDLGFNDKGESIPFQGGTNQAVVIKMYKALKKVKKQENLVVYWYTGKDQIRPINAVLKSRNCHVKFMAIDDEVGIQGNGNQDTQSWFHSQEINVMIDSQKIVKEWMNALISNQNTELYGKVRQDGIWRDEAGRTVDYYDNPKLSKGKKTSELATEMAIVEQDPTGVSEGQELRESDVESNEPPSPVLTIMTATHHHQPQMTQIGNEGKLNDDSI